MSLALTSNAKALRLRDRAFMLAQARRFFAERNILEVDVPLLTQKAPIDTHIDLIQAQCMGKGCYLQSSPEYGMKRLLAEECGDIYQLSHVFRDEEVGERHNPEFTMAEWYRIGFTIDEMEEETIAFLSLFLSCPDVERYTYRQAVARFYGKPIPEEERDQVFAFEIEPKFAKNKFTVLYDFPPEMAALAQVREKNGEKVALRFEIFYGEVELANGYKELTDPEEQRKRLLEANKKRKELNKTTYPMDTYFLEALKKGLPDMCGVACGFDRLMMLRHKASHIEEVIPFSWSQV